MHCSITLNLLREMMEHKDRMTNLLASQLKQKVDDEDKRIERATKEREEKLQLEMKSKEDKLRRDLAGIAAHRNEQVGFLNHETFTLSTC